MPKRTDLNQSPMPTSPSRTRKGNLRLRRASSYLEDGRTSLSEDDDPSLASLDLGHSSHDPDGPSASKHECNDGCGSESWIQDLSLLSHHVKLSEVPPGTKPIINQPTYHHQGSQGRWYCVYTGKAVGIFNDW